MAKKIVRLKPIQPDKVIGIEYQSRLVKEIKKLKAELLDEIRSCYGELAQDANPVTQIDFALKRIFDKFGKRFDNLAKLLSVRFVNQISLSTRRKLQAAAKDLLTIEPDKQFKNLLLIKQALIKENVQLIKDLPEKMYNQIHGDLMRNFATGGNLQKSEKELLNAGLPPLTKTIKGIEVRVKSAEKRARFISRDQLFKANGIINNARMLDNGITKSEWNHSHGDKTPRPDHLAANGKIYENDKGCLISGEYLLPGQLINCTCFATPVIEI